MGLKDLFSFIDMLLAVVSLSSIVSGKRVAVDIISTWIHAISNSRSHPDIVENSVLHGDHALLTKEITRRADTLASYGTDIAFVFDNPRRVPKVETRPTQASKAQARKDTQEKVKAYKERDANAVVPGLDVLCKAAQCAEEARLPSRCCLGGAPPAMRGLEATVYTWESS